MSSQIFSWPAEYTLCYGLWPRSSFVQPSSLPHTFVKTCLLTPSACILVQLGKNQSNQPCIAVFYSASVRGDGCFYMKKNIACYQTRALLYLSGSNLLYALLSVLLLFAAATGAQSAKRHREIVSYVATPRVWPLPRLFLPLYI